MPEIYILKASKLVNYMLCGSAGLQTTRKGNTRAISGHTRAM
jgi:hypothetical protein